MAGQFTNYDAVGSFLNAAQGMQKIRSNEQDMQLGQQKIEANRGQLLDQQQARVKAQQQQEMETQQRAKMLEIMQQAENKSKSMSELSVMAMHSGAFEFGSKIGKEASAIESQVSKMKLDEANAEIKKTEQILKAVDMFKSTVANAHSQEDYNKGVQRFEQLTGKPAPDLFKNLQWSDKTKQELEALGVDWETRNKANLERQKQAAKEVEDASIDRRRTIQNETNQAQTREHNARAANLEKNEGIAVRTPKEDVQAAVNIIKEHFPDIEYDPTEGQDNPAVANAANYIASRAQQLIKSNPGVSREQALYTAFSEARENGDLSQITEVIEKNWIFPDKTRETLKLNRGNEKSTTTFNSEADAIAAEKSGKLKKGTRIIINGVSGTWQ